MKNIAQRLQEIPIYGGAFLRTRFLAAFMKRRQDVEKWQRRQLERFLDDVLPKVEFYRDHGGKQLEDLPIVDKSMLMQNFSAFNTLGLDTAQGWDHFASGTSPIGYHLGASTGTSGNRGLYLISESERYRWLGTMLAKVLPAYPFDTARVAIVLPMNSALYKAAANAFRLAIRFFDLNDGLAALPARLADFGPDTLIAPPKVLRYLAENESPLRLRRVFSGAEVLDATDRNVIEKHFKTRIAEIYMATEGLLGTSCRHGRMHLAEDIMHFGFEDGPAGSGLKKPVITDFSRTTQIMARYRMNDLLRLDTRPCPCGSPMIVVEEIVGRADDSLLVTQRNGPAVEITPDVIRNLIVDADRGIDDFRVDQTAPDKIEIILPIVAQQCTGKVRSVVTTYLHSLHADPEVTVSVALLTPPVGKLRRVQRSWKRAP